jgi:hypothetical protein
MTESTIRSSTPVTPSRAHQPPVGSMVHYWHRNNITTAQLERWPRAAIVVGAAEDKEHRLDLVCFTYDGVPIPARCVPWSASPQHGCWSPAPADSLIGRIVTIQHADSLMHEEPQRRAALVLGPNDDDTLRCLLFNPHGERLPGLAARVRERDVQTVRPSSTAAVGVRGTYWQPPRSFVAEHKRCASIVTFLHSDGSVNLHLWLPDGSTFGAQRCDVSDQPTTGRWTPMKQSAR